MITYNHENHIKEAIESVLKQTCNFKVELIIANDCSTDSTDKVVSEIINKNISDVTINYINHKKNLGMMSNFVFALEKCQGKYIALLDGDDYWTDPLKLQKQVDFLEGSPDFGICFHEVEVFDEATNKIIEDSITRKVTNVTTIEELVRGNYLHTPSVMLRNDFIIPKWFRKSPVGDWSLYMLAIRDRKIKKLEDVMAVYRVHNSSIWSGLAQEVKDNKTKISINLIYKNVALPKKAKQILRSRLGLSKKKKSIYSRMLNKIKKVLK